MAMMLRFTACCFVGIFKLQPVSGIRHDQAGDSPCLAELLKLVPPAKWASLVPTTAADTQHPAGSSCKVSSSGVSRKNRGRSPSAFAVRTAQSVPRLFARKATSV